MQQIANSQIYKTRMTESQIKIYRNSIEITEQPKKSYIPRKIRQINKKTQMYIRLIDLRLRLSGCLLSFAPQQTSLVILARCCIFIGRRNLRSGNFPRPAWSSRLSGPWLPCVGYQGGHRLSAGFGSRHVQQGNSSSTKPACLSPQLSVGLR